MTALQQQYDLASISFYLRIPLMISAVNQCMQLMILVPYSTNVESLEEVAFTHHHTKLAFRYCQLKVFDKIF